MLKELIEVLEKIAAKLDDVAFEIKKLREEIKK